MISWSGFDIPVDDIDFMGLVETFRDMQGDFHCSDQIQLVFSDLLADGPDLRLNPV
jgi:hypothetical protein